MRKITNYNGSGCHRIRARIDDVSKHANPGARCCEHPGAGADRDLDP